MNSTSIRKQLPLPRSLELYRKELEERRIKGPGVLKDPIICRALKKQDEARRMLLKEE